MTVMNGLTGEASGPPWYTALTARAIAGGLAFLALIFVFSLVSHSSNDPTFWNAHSGGTRNWLGGFGANFSAAFFSAIGVAAWLIPCTLGLWVWRLWNGNWSRLVAVPLRLVPAGLLAVLCTAAFMSGLPGKLDGSLGFGGWFGDRVIHPFALAAQSLGFSAPYQLPGLLFLLAGITTFIIACGTTVPEARSVWRYVARSWRAVLGRDRRRAYREAALTRASDLRRRMQGTVPEVANPPSLAGEVPLDYLPEIDGDYEDDVDIPEAPVANLNQPGVRKTATAKPAPVKRVATPAARQRKKSAAVGANRAERLLSLLAAPARRAKPPTEEELADRSEALLGVLNDYGVNGEMIGSYQGPVVTLHEFEPAAGTKAARVVGLADDIARSMSALAARVAPVRGRSVIGIEMPNDQREMVYLREIVEKVVSSSTSLPLALGKEIDGTPKIASLTKMPHLLIAGTTGSGKSVGLNGMILSLLLRHGPEECRMIMIDPKMLELSVYDGIPHLLSPVVTDPKKAVMALKWVVREMEQRYQKMAAMNVRNLEGYNLRMRAALEAGETIPREVTDEFGETRIEEMKPETLPFIVVVVDEMADLMMVAGKEIEACIQRLAQMARASGIHLIMATQRPSVDVITGTIKANFPTRISFQVTSKIDSRTILGEMGAEQLLGQGDMLYMAGGGRITRIHGPFVSDEEVQRVAEELRFMGGPEDQVSFEEESGSNSEIDEILGLGGGSDDASLYDQAVAIVARDRRATTSYIQRRLQIGYNRAARLIEQMEDEGVITRANSAGKREIMIEER